MGQEHYTYDVTIFIGRFQPVHLGHLRTIRLALTQSYRLIIIIGSFKSASSFRHPWTAYQRVEMIKKCLTLEEKKRILFIPIRDRLYSDIVWKQNIINEVSKVTNENTKIAIIGHIKDPTSYYLKIFPNWKFIETGNLENINSTDFRKKYFSASKFSYKFIPHQIKKMLKRYRYTAEFEKLKGEYAYVDKMKKSLSVNSFTVCNSLLICGHYILLIRRKNYPGKLLFALPGGHLENGEELENGALRELYEETNLNLNPQQLKPFFIKKFFFDYPERNPIVRSYAHVFFFQLEAFIECPKVTAGDDALSADWYLLDELSFLEDKFFSDHYQIIQTVLGRIQ